MYSVLEFDARCNQQQQTNDEGDSGDERQERS